MRLFAFDIRHLLCALTVLFAAVMAVACGGSSPKSTAASAPTATAGTSSGTPQRGFSDRTPSADRQTSIAEGTPRGFGNRTPPPEIQTSIAEGTPAAFGNRTPSADVQTAIAQGTPASDLRGPRGGGRLLAAVAGVLAIDLAQLRSELDAPGATIAGVAAAHGQDRATFRQALIDAMRQSLSDAVANGAITQDAADQALSQLEANIDTQLDGNGRGPEAPPPP